ncbi:hypothetical protein ACTFIW_008811 [Dictyostelium discoideum]
MFPESGAGATLKKGNKIIKTWSFQWSTTQSNMSSNRREMLALLMAYQETMSQEESELDWRAYSRILQCKSPPPQPSFRDESQIIVQSNQELQLATEEGSVQSNRSMIAAFNTKTEGATPKVTASDIESNRPLSSLIALARLKQDASSLCVIPFGSADNLKIIKRPTVKPIAVMTF